MRLPPGLAIAMSERSSVAVHARSWRGIFLAVFVTSCVAKLVIACTLSPFGDEAFYWQESLSPAWGYSDLPPLTAWLIAASEAVFGHGLLPMRLPFLLIGAALPWQVGAMAARYGGEQARWQAATFAALLPLAGSLGVLALPDVPLTFATLLALHGLLIALDTDRFRGWLLLGLGLAIAWMTHYRAAMPMLGGLLFLLLTPRGRLQWRHPGLWIAMGIAALGLLPIVLYNLGTHGAGLAFQLVDRNPWRFHADALVQPLEQAVACTPLAWVALLWVMARAWRRRGEPPLDAIAVIGGTFVVAYFVLGLFADDLRFRAHWPLPGYLVACVGLPLVLRDSRGAWRRTVQAGFMLAGLGLAAGLAYLGLAASTHGATVLAGMKAFPTNFTGWRESAAASREALATRPDAVLVADNFMLAAELRFALGAPHAIYSLDSPLNAKHGRAPQLASWGLDEAGLAKLAGRRILLVVDESKLHDVEARDWLGSICARVDIVAPAGRVEAFGKRRSFALYEGRVKASRGPIGHPDDCIVWMAAYKASLAR